MSDLNQHYQNNVESEADKYRRYFHNRYQEETETAEEFLSELKRLTVGSHMNLEMPPEALEKVIRDRFIEGLKSQHVQDFIVSQIRNDNSEISLPKLLEIVQTLEEEELAEDEDDDEDDVEDVRKENFGNERNVEIKSESEDLLIRQPSQLFPITFNGGQNFQQKFATLSAKMRAQRSELECHICQFKCLSKVLLSSHLMMAHQQLTDSRHLKCDVCGAVFLSKVGLETHQVMLHGKSKSEMINRRIEMNIFDRSTDNGDASNDNDKDFVFYDDLVGNGGDQDVFEAEDKKTRSFCCEICHYRTSTASQLRKHHQLFHNDTEIKHQCRDCLYRAVTEEALIRHIAQNHKKAMAQKMKCELCDFVTLKKTELTRHLQNSHRGHKVYMCETCGKKFQTDKTLEVHHRVVHLNQKPFSCKLCDYKAGQKASLIAHNHSVHEGNKPYVCESCGYKTTSQSTLNAHKRMVHEKQRPYVCDHCGRSFAARAGMENHIQLIHEKQTPFTCDRCGKKFKRRPDLNNHIRCIHENNYYVCTVCNNSFQTARNLERHISTVHEQMKPFECTTCGQAFARRERLKHHIERNHQLIGVTQQQQQQHPVPSTTPASVMSESHHSNMASPHVPASQDHFVHHGHLGHHDPDQQQQLHDLHLSNRHTLLHVAQHSQPHPMVLLVHQQQQQQHQLHH